MKFRSALMVSLIVTAFTASSYGQRLAAVRRAPSAPPIPMAAHPASRGAMLSDMPHARHIAPQQLAPPPTSGSQTVLLPLSAGLSMISIPVRTESRMLSALLPNLPAGARVWTWDAHTQQFIEGFDQELPLGRGVFLFLPAPAVLTVTGETDLSSEIPVELENGWNLIGVPYTTPLLRAGQTTWMDGVETGFNDAVEQGAFQEPVFSLDIAGYQEVGPDDSFEPMHAYWVYANGVDELAMHPLLLGDALKEFAWWSAKQAGAAGFQYGAGQLLALMSPDPNQPILDKLAAIATQLNDIQATQQRILDQFAVTRTQIQMTEAQILGVVGEVNVKNVRSDVAAHFDDPTNQNASFMYFANQAKTEAGRKLVTDANKTDFARNVLTTWNFTKQFNDVQEAVAPSDGSLGVLDYFADKIVLSGATNSTLQDRYKAMEAYFNGLVGVQVKIMTLLTNSWNTLAKVPNSGYSADFADQWRATTYTNALAKEALRFRDASEKVMAGSLRVSSELNEAPVSLPPEMVNTIIPSADFGVMQLANEAPGVRVRIFAGRYLNEPDTYTMVDNSGRTILAVPAADSGLWKTLPAGPGQIYDAWRVRGNPGAFNSKTATWEFYRDPYWIMYRTTLPTTMAQGSYSVRLVDKWGVTDDNATPSLYGWRGFRIGPVDDNNRPSSTGTLFGSLALAKRAAARTALRVYNDGASSVWNNCNPGLPATSFGKENDYFTIRGNCFGRGGWAAYQRLIPFYFAGPEASAAGDWQMAITTRIGGNCTVNADTCSTFYSQGNIQLLDNGNDALIITRYNTATQTSAHQPIRWDKTHGYQFHLRLMHTGTSNGVATEVWRGGLLIRFNQTP